MIKQRLAMPPAYYEERVELPASQLFALAIENAGGPDLSGMAEALGLEGSIALDPDSGQRAAAERPPSNHDVWVGVYAGPEIAGGIGQICLRACPPGRFVTSVCVAFGRDDPKGQLSATIWSNAKTRARCS